MNDYYQSNLAKALRSMQSSLSPLDRLNDSNLTKTMRIMEAQSASIGRMFNESNLAKLSRKLEVNFTSYNRMFNESNSAKIMRVLEANSVSLNKMFNESNLAKMMRVLETNSVSLNKMFNESGLSKTLRAMQSPVMKTIDFACVYALANDLGQEGIEEQWALIGIDHEGTMHPLEGTPEQGILSYKQPNAVVRRGFAFLILVSCFSILFRDFPQNLFANLVASSIFYYVQDNQRQQDKAEAKRQQDKAEASQKSLEKQIESLAARFEQIFGETAQESVEHFEVRNRIARVRSKPENGSSVECKLFPYEVVRSIGHKGKWVEIEYYHWRHKKYCTGWVLKKYIERLPANYLKS